jgi:hypothetical protein
VVVVEAVAAEVVKWTTRTVFQYPEAADGEFVVEYSASALLALTLFPAYWMVKEKKVSVLRGSVHP